MTVTIANETKNSCDRATASSTKIPADDFGPLSTKSNKQSAPYVDAACVGPRRGGGRACKCAPSGGHGSNVNMSQENCVPASAPAWERGGCRRTTK